MILCKYSHEKTGGDCQRWLGASSGHSCLCQSGRQHDGTSEILSGIQKIDLTAHLVQMPLTQPIDVGSRSSRKNSNSHIDASHSRQPLVKGERLVRYEVNAVMLLGCLVGWPSLAPSIRAPALQSLACLRQPRFGKLRSVVPARPIQPRRWEVLSPTAFRGAG